MAKAQELFWATVKDIEPLELRIVDPQDSDTELSAWLNGKVKASDRELILTWTLPAPWPMVEDLDNEEEIIVHKRRARLFQYNVFKRFFEKHLDKIAGIEYKTARSKVGIHAIVDLIVIDDVDGRGYSDLETLNIRLPSHKFMVRGGVTNSSLFHYTVWSILFTANHNPNEVLDMMKYIFDVADIANQLPDNEEELEKPWWVLDEKPNWAIPGIGVLERPTGIFVFPYLHKDMPTDHADLAFTSGLVMECIEMLASRKPLTYRIEKARNNSPQEWQYFFQYYVDLETNKTKRGIPKLLQAWKRAKENVLGS